MTNVIQYRDASDTTRGPSPVVWGDCPWMEIQAQVAQGAGGYSLWDDFINASNTDAGLHEGAGESAGSTPYILYGDTGVLIKTQPSTTEVNAIGGVLQMSVNDTDNDEGSVSGGSPTFIVSDTAAYSKKLWFEARIKSVTVADNGVAQFIGLAWDHAAQTSMAKANALVDDTGALGTLGDASCSFLGFHQDLGDADAWNFVYKAEGQAETELISGVDTAVADTYAKFGFVYDPDAVDAKKIKIYVDGAEQSTYGTATNIAAATFPDAEAMAPFWATKVGTGSAAVLCSLDWWRVAQLG